MKYLMKCLHKRIDELSTADLNVCYLWQAVGRCDASPLLALIPKLHRHIPRISPCNMGAELPFDVLETRMIKCKLP
jgi:hypothetical protein